jgi:hypothetical protein
VYLNGLARTALDPGGIEWLRLFNAYPAAGAFLDPAVAHGTFRALVALVCARPSVGIALVATAIPLVVLLSLGAVGLRVLWQRAPGRTLLLMAVGTSLTIVAGGPQGYSRFRHPVTPLLAVAAAAALDERSRRLAHSGTQPVESES